MTLIARTIFILMLVLGPAGQLVAQNAPATKPADPEVSASPAETPTSEAETTMEAESLSTDRHYRIREQFTRLLQRHPDELWMLLKLDPALLTNDAFMSGYPEVQEFLVQHPEVLKNPRFYLSQFASPAQYRNSLDGVLELLGVLGGISLSVIALAWLIRTLIEQNRWKQLSRTQSEVHNKILDRFNTSEQLLEYIHTPAGGKFLESAPIPLHVERQAGGRTSSLATRIVWSVQIGVVTAIVGIGMLVLSAAFEKDSSQGLFALGAIALCLGIGSIVSAFVSLSLSRRLGLWEEGGGTDAVR